jgi:midasin
MQELSWPTPPGDLALILPYLEHSKSGPLSHSICRFLGPALLRLVNTSGSRRQIIANLGLCWIALSRTLLDLYIPDIPIDPSAAQHCTRELLCLEEAILSSEVDLHSRFEQRTTGNSNNNIVAYLQERLNEVSRSLVDMSPIAIPTQRDVSRLHMFWSEVSQFQSQVIAYSRIDSLLDLLDSGDKIAQTREQVVQGSISGFCQRLNLVYPEYADLNVPLQLAFSYHKLGLRLAAHAAVFMPNNSPDVLTPLVAALVAFPSVCSSTMLLTDLENNHSTSMGTSQHLMLKLAAISFERFLGIDLEAHIGSVETTYDQIFRLWSIDRAREDDTDLASQSLYKRTTIERDVVADAEVEEREFLALFPQFEDVLQRKTEASRKSPSHPLLSDPAHKQFLISIHQSIVGFSGRNADLASDPLAVFNILRQSELENLLDTRMESLSDVIDDESYAFQFSFIHDQLSALRGGVKSSKASYNFYADANTSEIRKAAVVVEDLKNRLGALIRQWPDQMVLQSLQKACDFLLDLDLYSPVPKVLSALEQLLVQSDDWEIYANRENTLKAHQQAITSLVVDWRRLELSSWQVLLQAQARSFSQESSEWWFHLYNAIIRGALDVLHEDLDQFTNYLNKLSLLLDDFMRSSPLGQYDARLQLLRSFSHYASCLAQSKGGQLRLGIKRIKRLLHATAQYYELFFSSISSHLSQQEAMVEKEIRSFIKLASWRDANVHSLKQSAQKTHHQLYKCIRKFRDILRQPITQWLQPELAGDTETRHLPNPSDYRVIIHPWPELPPFPDAPRAGTSSNHLSGLDLTFRRFDTLIANRIGPFIRSHIALTVENFAIEIISTAKALSALSIRNSDPHEKREKLRKSFLARKRRAWSDLLKELKRTGLAANTKPDVLERLGDMRWIREQPIIANLPNGFIFVEKSEVYLNRLYGTLPQIRELLCDHHPDLTTRELQRGVSFLESGFAMALDTRSWYEFQISA